MSTDYGLQDRVPTDILAKRLQELSMAVTEGREAVSREFTMRVPAECDRDADLVLSAAAKRLMEFLAAERQGVSIEPKRLVIGPATEPEKDKWSAMVYAPLDGTKVTLLIRHTTWWAAHKYDPARANIWEAECEGHWIDHNGGGWTWAGMAGTPIGWRALKDET